MWFNHTVFDMKWQNSARMELSYFHPPPPPPLLQVLATKWGWVLRHCTGVYVIDKCKEDLKNSNCFVSSVKGQYQRSRADTAFVFKTTVHDSPPQRFNWRKYKSF